MCRFIFSVFVIIVLSACAGRNHTVEVLPSSTIIPSPIHTEMVTPTITASEMPLQLPSLTPVSPSLILADFPLVEGTTWKYSAEISYQDPKDYSSSLTWIGTVTDKVIDKKIVSDGKIVFKVKEDLDPTPPQDVWRQSSVSEYTISGDGVFDGGTKIYQYPLSDNLSWKRWADFQYTTDVTGTFETTTPYGKLNGCYSFFILTSPDVMQDTFCPGIGFVSHHYKHFGTPQNESFELISYETGK